MSEARLKRRGTGFTAVPNSFIRDDDLSGDARMLFMLLFSHSENWVFRVPQIGKNLGYGKDRLRNAKNALIERGFLSVSQPKDEKGRVIPGPWDWEISLDPALPFSARRKSAQATARPAEIRPPLEEQGEENQVQEIVDDSARDPDLLDRLSAGLHQATGQAVDWQNASIAVLSIPLGWVTGSNAFDLDLDVLPTIRAICQARDDPEPIRSWRYFEKPIAKARDQRLSPNPKPVSQDHAKRDKPRYSDQQTAIHAKRRSRLAGIVAERKSSISG